VWTLSPVAPLSLRLCYYVHLAWAARSLKHTDTQQRLESRAQSLTSALIPSLGSYLWSTYGDGSSASSSSSSTAPSPREVLEIGVALLTVSNYYSGVNSKVSHENAFIAHGLFVRLHEHLRRSHSFSTVGGSSSSSSSPLLSSSLNTPSWTDELSILVCQLTAISLAGTSGIPTDDMRQVLTHIDQHITIASGGMCAPPGFNGTTSALIAGSLLTTEQLPPSWTYVPSAVPPAEHARSVQWSLVSPSFVPPLAIGLARGLSLFHTLKGSLVTVLHSVPPIEFVRAPAISSSQTMQYLSIMEQLECLTSDLPPRSWLHVLLAYLRTALLLISSESTAYVAAATRATRMLELKLATESLAFAPAFLIYPVHYMSFVTHSIGLQKLHHTNNAMLQQLRMLYPDQTLRSMPPRCLPPPGSPTIADDDDEHDKLAASTTSSTTSTAATAAMCSPSSASSSSSSPCCPADYGIDSLSLDASSSSPSHLPLSASSSPNHHVAASPVPGSSSSSSSSAGSSVADSWLSLSASGSATAATSCAHFADHHHHHHLTGGSLSASQSTSDAWLAGFANASMNQIPEFLA